VSPRRPGDSQRQRGDAWTNILERNQGGGFESGGVEKGKGKKQEWELRQVNDWSFIVKRIKLKNTGKKDARQIRVVTTKP